MQTLCEWEGLNNLNVFSPWVVFVNKVAALFGDDPEIEIEYDNDAVELTLRVANQSKADAIAKLLGESRQFGNVVLKVNVVPANEDESDAGLIRRALAGNPHVWDFTDVDAMGFKASYVIFNPEVIQYKSDDLQSAFGVSTTVAEQICRDVFDGTDGVFFCTVPVE